MDICRGINVVAPAVLAMSANDRRHGRWLNESDLTLTIFAGDSGVMGLLTIGRSEKHAPDYPTAGLKFPIQRNKNFTLSHLAERVHMRDDLNCAENPPA
jgi:hypothetical protein